MLHWSTDPLLLDKQATSANKWVTANSLLAKHGLEWVLQEDLSFTNLYGILVRKIDFVRKLPSDRILSRFPFLVLTDEQKEAIHSKDLLISETIRDYFYRSINDSIMNWRKRIQHYLDRGAMPYPLVRCSWEVLDSLGVSTDCTALAFESARGKNYTIPCKLSNTLTYLCGVLNGDGHLHHHWLRIVDETKEHIELLSSLLGRLFHDSGAIFKTGNAWNVELRSSAAVRLFNFLTDQTIKGAKYDSLREPFIFKQLGGPYRNLYWRGAMDADGTFSKHISLASASREYLEDFKTFLESISIQSTIYRKKNGGFYLYLPSKHKLDYTEKIGVLNPKKMTDLFELLTHNISHITFKGINKEAITPEGFFDLTLLPSLQVQGLGDYLHSYRDERPYSTVRQQLGISQGLFAKYEQEIHAIPLSLLQKIVTKQKEEKRTLMQLLYSLREAILFRSASSPPIKLPMKATPGIIHLLEHLLPRDNYMSLTNNSEDLVKQVSNSFQVRVEKKRIKGRLLVNYLNTFCIYEKKKITASMINTEKLKANWLKDLDLLESF